MHAILVRHKLVGGQAYQAVMSLSIVFIDKMHIVGGNKFYVILARQCYKFRLDCTLFFVSVMGGVDHSGFMSLQFDVIIFAHQVFPPRHGGFVATVHQQLRNLASKTS